MVKGISWFNSGYYRPFIKNYAVISRHLTLLLKKGYFQWNEVASKAFEELKEAMVKGPVLGLPDFSKTFTVEVDASGVGMGAVLTQNGRPLAYLSQALSPKNLGLSTYEKELAVLLIVVEKWRHYLQPNKFLICTNHFSLKFLRDQRVTTSLQHKGVTKLMGLDYEIQYRQGIENVVADALSRKKEVSGEFNGLSTVQPKWAQEIMDNYIDDTEAQQLIMQLSIDPTSSDNVTF